MYWQCNTSQYIIKVLGCITRCIVMYSLMYQDVFGEVFGFMSRRGIHLNTSGNTSQYIVEYIIIPLKYIPIHLWCIGMLIHPKNIWYIQNTSQYIPIHPVHPPRFANVHQQIGVKLLQLIFLPPNYWLLLAIIGYYCYYWVAKSITIIGYYWTTPKTLIIGINRNLLLQLIFLGTNYCN